MKVFTTTFLSKKTAVTVISGTVIGLGNIWAFAGRVGENEGGIFILAYLLSTIFVAMPIFMIEMIIGKNGKSDVMSSIKKLDGEKSFFIVSGALSLISSFLVLIFYSIVAGWLVIYFYEGLLYSYSAYTSELSTLLFSQRTASKNLGVIVQSFFIFLTVLGVIIGTRSSIEKYSKVFLPVILLLLIALSLRNATLEGTSEAYKFLFSINFKVLEGRYLHIFLTAMSQALFSLSLGMGVIITSGTYINNFENISAITIRVTALNFIVSILVLLALYPVIFTQGIDYKEGINLFFITLPVGVLEIGSGRFIGVVILFMVFLAAITSAFACLECIVAHYINTTKLSRVIISVIVGVLIVIISAIAQPNMGVNIEFLNWTGKINMMHQIIYFVSIVTLPIGALTIVIFAGYRLNKNLIESEFSKNKNAKIFINYIRYVLPVLMGSIILLYMLNYL